MSTWIQGVHHIAVKPTPDQYEKTVDFYTRVLGMEIVRAWGPVERPMMMVSCGDNSCIEILRRETEAPADGAFPHVALATERVDELIERVRAEGYPIKEEPHTVELAGTPCRIAFLYGPVGEEIELFWENCHG